MASLLLTERTQSAKDVCAFEDYDSLEGGLSREFLAAELLSPSSSQKKGIVSRDETNLAEHPWLLCRLTRPQKDEFRLCNEKTGQFLLSAKQIGDDFYISAYEDMRYFTNGSKSSMNDANTPQNNEQRQAISSKINYAAILTPYGGQGRQPVSYRLHLCSGTQRCLLPDDCNAEPLVEVWPSALWSQEQQVELRRLRVRMPSPRIQIPAHYIHDCASPTSLRPSHPGFFKSKRRNSSITSPKILPQQNSKNLSTSPSSSIVSSPKTPHTQYIPPVDDDDESNLPSHITLQNKLPKWNAQLGCLSLHFGRKRVKASSSKNFLIYTDSVLADPDLSDYADQAVFQLGKLASRTFSLDFRYPLSPLQAFAIALTAFNAKRIPKPSR